MRFPKHKVARSILNNINFPLAMPSANLSSNVSPVCAKDVFDEFNKKTRKHHQIYNMHDSCCYRKPYSSMIKNVATKLEDKNFEIIELNRNTHDIDTNFLFSKF